MPYLCQGLYFQRGAVDKAGQPLNSHLAGEGYRVGEAAQQAAHYRGQQHLVTTSLQQVRFQKHC